MGQCVPCKQLLIYAFSLQPHLSPLPAVVWLLPLDFSSFSMPELVCTKCWQRAMAESSSELNG